MVQLEYDRSTNTLRIKIDGFLTLDDVPVLARTIGAKAQEARQGGGDFNVIVDSRDFPVQANNVADILPEIMKGGMALTSGHAAVVVGSHLSKLQAARTLVHPRLKVFLSLHEARLWLAQRTPNAVDA